MEQIKNTLSLILRSKCHFSGSLQDGCETTYFQGKTQEFVGDWLKRDNP